MSNDIDFDAVEELVTYEDVILRPASLPQPAAPRLTFPDAPGYTRDYIDLPSGAEPRVERRWYRYRDGTVTVDLFWYGPCLHCGTGLWADVNMEPFVHIPDSQTLRIVEEGGREYRFCLPCANRPARVEQAIEANQGVYTAPFQWPETLRKRILDDPERRRRLLLSEVVAVVPRKGALIRPKRDGDPIAALVAFDKFVDGKVVDAAGVEHAVDEVEALVPAFPGVKYERAVGMPISTSHSGKLVKITAWRGKDPHVQTPDGRTQHWNSQHVAALAPILDPSTETLEEQNARLMRQQERLEQGMHARMVAEATARSWCTEFDNIIDVTGLPPRTQRNMVTGTMTFTHQVNGEVTDDLLEQIRRNWTNYIQYSSVVITHIERMPEERTPLITPA